MTPRTTSGGVPGPTDQAQPRCTTPGTHRHCTRFTELAAAGFFRTTSDDYVLSSIGIGTYLGEPTDDDDARYADALSVALASGINVIDTAINYRCQRSERIAGAALARAVSEQVVSRDEVLVCTKAGYVPLDGAPLRKRADYDAYLKREFFDAGVMAPADVVAGGHSLAPGFLRWSLERSRQNLGVRTVDLFYLHNPEHQLAVLPPASFREHMRAAFMVLEGAASRGDIGMYGVATWNGLRLEAGDKGGLQLAELLTLAREVAGDTHHFRAVQLPINLAMLEAVRLPNQAMPDGRVLPLLQAANELGVMVMASAPLMQAQLTRGLPESFRALAPAARTDAECALGVVRGLPGVTSALVGMRSAEHVRENVAGALPLD